MSGTGGAPGSNGIINSGYPIPSTPFVNPKTGIITTVWWRFLIALLARTGGPPGVVTEDVQLITTLQGLIDPDVPVNFDALLMALRDDGSDLAGLIAADVAVALAVQTVGADDVDDETIPPIPDDPVAIVDGWTWATRTASNVAAGTYTLMGWAPFAGSITALRAVVGPAAVGGLTETVSINGTPVTGISGVTVDQATVQSFPATGACNFIQGDLIQIEIVIASGTPVGAWSTVQYTRIPQ